MTTTCGNYPSRSRLGAAALANLRPLDVAPPRRIRTAIPLLAASGIIALNTRYER